MPDLGIAGHWAEVQIKYKLGTGPRTAKQLTVWGLAQISPSTSLRDFASAGFTRESKQMAQCKIAMTQNVT
jgi:hypothetical protein